MLETALSHRQCLAAKPLQSEEPDGHSPTLQQSVPKGSDVVPFWVVYYNPLAEIRS